MSRPICSFLYFLLQGGNLARGAVESAVAPFDVFAGEWFLNVLLFGVVGVLSYSLLVVAPRQ